MTTPSTPSEGVERPPIRCQACDKLIFDKTLYWNCPPLGAVCDACWPDQSMNYLREYRNPKKEKGPWNVIS